MSKPTYDVTVKYGTPGHEDEYVILIDGFDLNQYIPMQISDYIENRIMDFGFDYDWVSNRGSRIEVRAFDDLSGALKRWTQEALREDGFIK